MGADSGSSDPHHELHELCEALQALGLYLAALQQGMRAAGSGYPADEMIEKSLSQHARAISAAQRLQRDMSDGTEPA